jgi:hypothetical protein
MSGHDTHQPHGSGIRGLSLKGIDSSTGKYGRMFPIPPAVFKEDDLWALAERMKGSDVTGKDGADAEESDFGAAYTYFGQFIDHDLTFDPSTFAQQKSNPDAILNFRSPRFDLDNVYGRGPSDQPYLYDGRRRRLLLGEKLFLIKRNPGACDLPRSVAASDGTKRAIIGDPRNDENVIVSQFQGMMQRFHNRVADDMVGSNADVPFGDIAIEVRRHYQWAVVHDFLTKIVEREVLDEVSPAIADPARTFEAHPPQLKFYKFAEPRMPVEFSVAAYRLGHSMVRPGYRLNEFTDPIRIFHPTNPTMGLNAFGDFPKSWTIDWQRFIDLGLGPAKETPEDRVQLAYKIDTSLVEPLSELPHSVAGDEADKDRRLFSLAFRNLRRGLILRLPSGQAVAHEMKVTPLADDEIIIGAAENGSKENTTPDGEKLPSITDISGAFKRNCPLWVYILAEARRNFYGKPKRACLGRVGGKIVAETFMALLLKDETSIVNASDWRPRFGKSRGSFGLPDLLRIALGADRQDDH